MRVLMMKKQRESNFNNNNYYYNLSTFQITGKTILYDSRHLVAVFFAKKINFFLFYNLFFSQNNKKI
jgi:hypothetical protein